LVVVFTNLYLGGGSSTSSSSNSSPSIYSMILLQGSSYSIVHIVF